MRLRRLSLVLLSFYLVFVGGSAYYNFIFPVRVFHHGLMTALALGWLLHRIRKGRGLPQTPLNPALYGLVIVWGLSAASSVDPRMAFEHMWFLLLHLLIFWVITDLFQNGRHKLVMEIQFLLAALILLLSGLELASWYFGLGIVPGTQIGWIDVIGRGAWLPLELPRLALAMNISTLLAGYVAPLITIAAAWAISTRHRDYKPVLWMLVVGLGGVLILTFSRGGLISAAVSVAVFALLQLSRSSVLSWRLSPRVYLAGGFSILVMVVAGFAIITLSPSRSSGDQVRVDLARSAVEITADHPALGVGTGLFGRAYREYRTPELARDRMASAHNLYLNHVAETGLLGAIVGIALGWLLVKTWWHHWITARDQDRTRLAPAIAALMGVAAHSLVDVFTTTPVVLTLLVLLAYSVTPYRLEAPPAQSRLNRIAAAVGVVVFAGYGLWFIQMDRALAHYQRSLAGGETSIAAAQQATALDPGLNLYQLQVLVLNARLLADSDPAAARAAYEQALTIEPTWDTGWINLAALAEAQGDLDQAIQALERAYAINPLTSAGLHLGRIYEQMGGADDDRILQYYHQAMTLTLSSDGRLPLSTFWSATPLRRQALAQFAARIPLDLQYRIWQVHDPERSAALVPQTPVTAADFWVHGQHTYAVLNDPIQAAADFTAAITRAPRRGDYYAARARVTWMDDPAGAQRDLDLAELLGTRDEYPNSIRALVAEWDGRIDEAERLRAAALPGRSVPQEFAAVLYGGRFAGFDLPPEMRFPGPGRAALQPWYILAENALAAGERERAIIILEAVLDYAPDESEARQRLAEID